MIYVWSPAGGRNTPHDTQHTTNLRGGRNAAQRHPAQTLTEFVSDSDAATRARAALALGRLRSIETRAPLKRLLQDPSPAVRMEAAFALGQTPGAGLALQGQLPLESDADVRAAICEGLGKVGEPSAVPLLVRALKERARFLERAVVAESAAVALGRLAMSGTEEATSDAVVTALIEQLDRFDTHTRQGAAFALYRIGRNRLPTDLERLLVQETRREGDPDTRSFLLRALGRLDGPVEGRDELFQMLSRHGDSGVRINLARAAGTARGSGPGPRPGGSTAWRCRTRRRPRPRILAKWSGGAALRR